MCPASSNIARDAWLLDQHDVGMVVHLFTDHMNIRFLGIEAGIYLQYNNIEDNCPEIKVFYPEDGNTSLLFRIILRWRLPCGH